MTSSFVTCPVRLPVEDVGFMKKRSVTNGVTINITWLSPYDASFPFGYFNNWRIRIWFFFLGKICPYTTFKISSLIRGQFHGQMRGFNTFEFFPRSELNPTISMFHELPFLVFGQSRNDQHFSLILKWLGYSEIHDLVRLVFVLKCLFFTHSGLPISVYFGNFSILIIESKAFLSCSWLRGAPSNSQTKDSSGHFAQMYLIK